jgi:hypothetical protein
MLGLFWFGARVGGSGEEILDRPLSNFDVIGIPTSKEMMVMMMMVMDYDDDGLCWWCVRSLSYGSFISFSLSNL